MEAVAMRQHKERKLRSWGMRSRIVRPGYFTNENLAALEPHARLLYEGLWLLADNNCRLEDKPERIKATLFPYEPQIDIHNLLSLLEAEPECFIVRYAVEDRKIIWIPKMAEHQPIHWQELSFDLPSPDCPGEPSESGSLEAGDIPCSDIVVAWNEICGGAYGQIRMPLGDARIKNLQARWQENPDLDFWRDVFTRLSVAKHCLGENEKGWMADFDWLIKNNDGYKKLLEGKYDKEWKRKGSVTDINAARGIVTDPSQLKGGFQEI